MNPIFDIVALQQNRFVCLKGGSLSIKGQKGARNGGNLPKSLKIFFSKTAKQNSGAQMGKFA